MCTHGRCECRALHCTVMTHQMSHTAISLLHTPHSFSTKQDDSFLQNSSYRIIVFELDTTVVLEYYWESTITCREMYYSYSNTTVTPHTLRNVHYVCPKPCDNHYLLSLYLIKTSEPPPPAAPLPPLSPAPYTRPASCAASRPTAPSWTPPPHPARRTTTPPLPYY